MPAEHNWNLGFAMSNLAKLKIRWEKLADFHLNAFEVNFEEHTQRFDFRKKGLTIYYLLALILMFKSLW